MSYVGRGWANSFFKLVFLLFLFFRSPFIPSNPFSVSVKMKLVLAQKSARKSRFVTAKIHCNMHTLPLPTLDGRGGDDALVGDGEVPGPVGGDGRDGALAAAGADRGVVVVAAGPVADHVHVVCKNSKEGIESVSFCAREGTLPKRILLVGAFGRTTS